MIITSKLKLDMQTPGIVPTVHAVQNDSYSRNLEIALFSDRKPFVFPDGMAVVIRYRKSDGKGGEYDTLPDGTSAWKTERNVLTVALAPQVLVTPGSVHLSVTLLAGGTQLSVFPIHLAVSPIAAGKLAKSEDYFYITGLLPAPAFGKVGQSLRIAAVNDAGRITAVEATGWESLSQSRDPAAYGLPVLHLNGDTTGMSKDNAVTMDYVYGERTGTATVKWQGSSSLAYPKKNYTIQFENAFEAAAGWGEQRKYCLKANYIDFSHARNIVSAKLWGDIVKSRSMPIALSRLNDTFYPNNTAYTFEKGVLTAHCAVNEHGAFFLTDVKLPAGGYAVTCDVLFPEDATDLSVAAYFHRVDSAQQGVPKATATAAGVWEPITISTIWADGNTTLVSLSGTNTAGVKFRNICFNGLYGADTFYYSPLSQIQTLPNSGAIDGFPVCVFINGKYNGLYTLNIPKDGWMFGMGSGARECVLSAKNHSAATRFETAALCDGTDFEIEYITDEADTAWAVESVNTLISSVMNSTGSDIDSTIANYLDIDSAIDFYIFTALQTGSDNVDKNYLLSTYDGTKWFFSTYDMDSTFGNQWTGKGYDSAKSAPTLLNFSHKAMQLIRDYKTAEVQARYSQLRNAVLSEDNVLLAFENFIARIPSALYEEDTKLWPLIPGTKTNNIAQIANNYRLRVQLLDAQIEQIAGE